MKARILLIDDDPILRSELGTYLESEFFSVSVAADGDEGLAMLESVDPDIIILDVRMPERDGLETCRLIRQEYGYEAGKKGIIMVSGARKELADRVTGLEIGADRYLTKPVDPRLLLAEIQSLWRVIRSSHERRSGCLSIDHNVRLNLRERTIEIDGQPIELTKLEFDVLAYLADPPNTARSRSELARDVWEYEAMYDSPITKCIAQLRKKLEPEPTDPKYIKTVFGVGYKLCTNPPDVDEDNGPD